MHVASPDVRRGAAAKARSPIFLLKRNKYVGILSIAVTTLQYITISMITIFNMYIAHVR